MEDGGWRGGRDTVSHIWTNIDLCIFDMPPPSPSPSQPCAVASVLRAHSFRFQQCFDLAQGQSSQLGGGLCGGGRALEGREDARTAANWRVQANPDIVATSATATAEC
jgi:hypothetical protein